MRDKNFYIKNMALLMATKIYQLLFSDVSAADTNMQSILFISVGFSANFIIIFHSALKLKIGVEVPKPCLSAEDAATGMLNKCKI